MSIAVDYIGQTTRVQGNSYSPAVGQTPRSTERISCCLSNAMYNIGQNIKYFSVRPVSYRYLSLSLTIARSAQRSADVVEIFLKNYCITLH